MTTNKDMACRIVRPDSTFAGKQGLTYAEGISAESVGSKAICMHVLTMPPGARGKARWIQRRIGARSGAVSGEAMRAG